MIITALINTSQVLDENFSIKINKDQNIFTIYTEIEDLELYIKSIFKARKGVKIWVYIYKNEMLKCYTSEED